MLKLTLSLGLAQNIYKMKSVQLEKLSPQDMLLSPYVPKQYKKKMYKYFKKKLTLSSTFCLLDRTGKMCRISSVVWVCQLAASPLQVTNWHIYLIVQSYITNIIEIKSHSVIAGSITWKQSRQASWRKPRPALRMHVGRDWQSVSRGYKIIILFFHNLFLVFLFLNLIFE